MKNKIDVSIIICTYNGEKRIADCLDSIFNQDYSKRKFEIIVVNDGSTDKTLEVINRYKVKKISYKMNNGRYFARNEGLKASNGKIVVYTDDDCIAKNDWLRNLVLPFESSRVMAVGGKIIHFYDKDLMDRYYLAMGYGNPSPIEFGKSKNPISRFFAYLNNMFFPLHLTSNNHIDVLDIAANSAFLKKYLNSVGGWDPNFKFRGDADMCAVLKSKFLDKRIVFAKDAVIYHKHKMKSLFYVLKDNFKRSKNTLDFYKKHKKIPPIYPFPIFVISILILSMFVNLTTFLISIFVVPQVFYIWWLFRTITEKKLYYLFFPYIQFCLESSTILGLIGGMFKKNDN